MSPLARFRHRPTSEIAPPVTRDIDSRDDRDRECRAYETVVVGDHEYRISCARPTGVFGLPHRGHHLAPTGEILVPEGYWE